MKREWNTYNGLYAGRTKRAGRAFVRDISRRGPAEDECSGERSETRRPEGRRETTRTALPIIHAFVTIIFRPLIAHNEINARPQRELFGRDVIHSSLLVDRDFSRGPGCLRCFIAVGSATLRCRLRSREKRIGESE